MARNKPVQQQQQHLEDGMKNQAAAVSAAGGTSGEPPTDQHDVSILSAKPVARSKQEAVVQPKRYRVDVGGYVVIDGIRTPLRPGKIIRSCDYDIDKLLLQGIQLTDLTPPEEPPSSEEESSEEESTSDE